MERIQDEYKAQLAVLERYKPRNSDYVKEKKDHLSNAEKFYDRREMIINAFQDKIFPLSPEGFPEYEGRDEDENEDKIFTTKQVTQRYEISDFGIKEIFEDEQPDTTDIPDLETEESAEEKNNKKQKD